MNACALAGKCQLYNNHIFALVCQTKACGLQTKRVYMKSGTGERRRLAHFVGEDQDPSFWCSAPFDWFKRKLEKTKKDSVAASQLFHLLQ